MTKPNRHLHFTSFRAESEAQRTLGYGETMKHCVFILLALTFALTTSSHGDDVQEPMRRPAISIEDAMAKARNYVQDKKLDVSKQYIDSVVLEPNPRGDRGRFWRVTWQQNEFMKGGQTYINIYMDGSVEHAYGK